MFDESETLEKGETLNKIGPTSPWILESIRTSLHYSQIAVFNVSIHWTVYFYGLVIRYVYYLAKVVSNI